ncbi:GNAT family N-acetyltransferase [Devosia sp.]|uniref:GNAT family N-acetyltransferase n=1 Tax=Devosia sp. TaxID=1871048 RepID=UPI0027366A57|nr:GNAT family N-acetyltransferase [Devosia sp.]MDP2779541.1 GNAT family N-acetyltransferase [Devosia sp.]
MTEDTNPPSYIIRLARPADIPAIRSMQERSMWVLGGDFYSANDIASFLTLFGTMDDAVVDEGHYFVAEDRRGAILGSGGWTRSRPRYATASAGTRTPSDAPTVRSVFVDPAATRRGVASAIMARTEQDAVDHGAEMLQLTATLSGVALYHRLGYQTEEVTALELPDRSRFECVRMRKALGTLRFRAA